MPITIDELEKLGLTAEQIVAVLRLQRKDWSERKRTSRARSHVTVTGQSRDPPQHLTPPLPSRLEPSGSNLSGRKTKRRKIPLPSDWEPTLDHYRLARECNDWDQQRVQYQADRFRENAGAKAWRYADWDLTFNNCIRDRWFEKPTNGGRSNGRHETLAEQTKRLADACREREQELGAGLFGAPHDVGGRRGSG